MSSPTANSNYSIDKPKRKSARGRQLKRWDAGEDQLLLLYVDHVCVTNGIAIPWDDVAIAMEPRDSASGGIPMTGEAIKQHLAKVRAARESADMTVPPKLDRAARRRAANCMKNGVPMTPASVKGKVYGIAYETPKVLQRSSLLAPPSRKDEAKVKRALQKGPAVKTKATLKTPSKRGRGRPTKKKVEDDDDDKDEYFDTLAVLSGPKKLRALETKNHALPGADDDENDDEEDKALFASGDGIYDGPGESDCDERATKKAKTEKKAVSIKGGVKTEANKIKAPVTPMVAQATPAETRSTSKPYGTKESGFDHQYVEAIREDSAFPDYGRTFSQPKSFVGNTGLSSKSILEDMFGMGQNTSSNMPFSGNFSWMHNEAPLNTNSFAGLANMADGHFDGLPGGLQAGSFRGPGMSTTLSQEMSAYGSTPTLASGSSFDSLNSFNSNNLTSWAGIPSDDSVPRFQSAQEFEQGFQQDFSEDAGLDELSGFTDMGMDAFVNLEDADAGFGTVFDSKESAH